jgi:site-specific DNA-methyltransferase (adenine-specific)
MFNWETYRNKFLLGDCMELMPAIPDKFFDLAVVDPPYGIGMPKFANLEGHAGRKPLEERLEKNRLNIGAGKLKNRVLNCSNTAWDNETPSNEYFEQLKRISKNQIIWGGNYFNLPPTRCVISWDKCQPWINFSQWEMAWSSFDKPAALFQFDNRTGDKIHPTQKPIELYLWLIERFAKPGDKIFDSHVGSASSLIACIRKGHEYLGIEKDPDYHAAATKRIENELHKKDETAFVDDLALFKQAEGY